MVFTSIGDSLSAAAPTWAFSTSDRHPIQDHPAYIPHGQRWPLRPELAALLGIWSLSQLTRDVGDRTGWRLCGDVAVLSCCTSSAQGASRAEHGVSLAGFAEAMARMRPGQRRGHDQMAEHQRRARRRAAMVPSASAAPFGWRSRPQDAPQGL